MRGPRTLWQEIGRSGRLGWAKSIRFRLALNYGLVVFAFGSLLVGGIYVYQARQLNEPVVAEAVLVVDNQGNEFVAFSRQQAELELFERRVNRRSLDQLRRGSLVGVGALALISFGGGWMLAGTALRPVNRIIAVARDITGSDLTRRIDMPGPTDELTELADTFDGMLDRLQDSFEEQRRFLHEASHDLRNPLAVARTNLELALTADGRDPVAGPDDDDLRRAAVIAFGATGRMSVLVDELLEQARSGLTELARTPVEITELLRDLAAEYDAATTAAHIALDTSGIDPEPRFVLGDEPALRRAITNLIANALRFAPAGSTISLAVDATPGWVTISVADEGPGVALEDQPFVFERFWRGSDLGAGSGLGLSIVAQIAQRHGGEANLEPNHHPGALFRMVLPLRQDLSRLS